MKAQLFHEMSTNELNTRLNELKSELFNLRFQLATSQLTNHMIIKETKHDIARVKTILRAREIKAKA